MRRGISIRAPIVHVDVHVSADPPRMGTMPLDRPEPNGGFRGFAGHHLYSLFFESVLEAAHDSYLHLPGWHRNLRDSVGVKVVRFKRTLLAIEVVVRFHPRVFR